MPAKRILISYFFGDDMIPLGVSCAEAFRRFGCEVYCFNSQIESPWERAFLKPVNRLARAAGYRNREIGKSLPIARINFKKRMLERAAREFRPQWIFVIRAHEFVDAELVATLKGDCGVEKVLGWRVDGPDTPGLLDDAAIYDGYYCSHRHGYDPRVHGIHYLPVYGMDLARYRNFYVDTPRVYRRDMVFVGGRNTRRQQFMDHLLDLPLDIYGKWGKRNRLNFALLGHVKAKGAWGDTLLDVYNTSKIVLNITSWDPGRYPALNQRVFDVPATGAFLLTDYSPELEEHYRVDEEIVCFASIEELREKALYYLAHDAQRETIARKGYEKALKLPTIADRMKMVMEHAASPMT